MRFERVYTKNREYPLQLCLRAWRFGVWGFRDLGESGFSDPGLGPGLKL